MWVRGPDLLLDNRAVGQADLAPAAVQFVAIGAIREFRRGLLVDFDAPSRLVARIHVAVLQFGTAVEDFLRAGR